MRERLPHALLITGPAGIGKRDLAAHFAQALLCEAAPDDGNPCGTCGACRWFDEGNHPDFRLVVPEVLMPEPEPVDGDTGEGGAEEPGTKARAAPSKVIKIAQIRSLDTFFQVGTHRSGRRVILVYPADKLNVDAANTLLKVLEEPPAGTVFLLVTSRFHDMLATVRSRCSRVHVARPAQEAMQSWLAAQGVRSPALALAEAGGAPLAAASEDPAADTREALLAALAAERPLDPVLTAERCEKAGAQNLSLWMARWISDLIAVNAGGEVRYHPQHRRAIESLAGRLAVPEAHAFFRRLMRARRVADHPLNARLFAEELLIDYARLAAPRA